MAERTRNQRGASVIEILIALGMGAVIIASVGNVLLSVQRVSAESANKEKAVAYARQALEIVAAQQGALFSCSTTAGPCACVPLAGYTSCWPAYNGAVVAPFPAIDPAFTRAVTAADWKRGDTGVPDTNVKKIVSTVSWVERGNTKSVSLSLILSAWKNL